MAVTVIGDGATGVELTDSPADLRTIALPAYFPEIDPARVHITLIQHGPALVAPFHPALRDYTRRQLMERGVEVRLGTAIAEIAPGKVVLADGSALRTALASAPATGDPRLAERLIANLADNALRHNTPGGHVEVVTRTKDSHAVLSVINTGAVIPAAAIDRLLQPFQRLGSDRTGHEDGLGLGLSIVQAIARAHGAALTIRPQPSGGLQAEVSFPRPSPASGTHPRGKRPLSAEPARQAT